MVAVGPGPSARDSRGESLFPACPLCPAVTVRWDDLVNGAHCPSQNPLNCRAPADVLFSGFPLAFAQKENREVDGEALSTSSPFLFFCLRITPSDSRGFSWVCTQEFLLVVLGASGLHLVTFPCEVLPRRQVRDPGSWQVCQGTPVRLQAPPGSPHHSPRWGCPEH